MPDANLHRPLCRKKGACARKPRPQNQVLSSPMLDKTPGGNETMICSLCHKPIKDEDDCIMEQKFSRLDDQAQAQIKVYHDKCYKKIVFNL
ncbi:MAG: hypothetical protein QXE05_00245 [Nitrososphaeria archaeon]